MWQESRQGESRRGLFGLMGDGLGVTIQKGRQGVRLSIADMHAMAQARGGQCLSTEYRNTATKLRWQCAEGHVWEAAPAGLRTSGPWCPQCAFEKMRLKIGDMQAIAHGRVPVRTLCQQRDETALALRKGSRVGGRSCQRDKGELVSAVRDSQPDQGQEWLETRAVRGDGQAGRGLIRARLSARTVWHRRASDKEKSKWRMPRALRRITT